MATIANHVKRIREAQDISYEKFARVISMESGKDITGSTLYRIENKKTNLQLDALQSLAGYAKFANDTQFLYDLASYALGFDAGLAAKKKAAS